MKRLTIEQALEQDDTINGIPYIYAYHDGETFFYIGISDQPYTRLEQHMGEGSYGTSPSEIGQLIIHNRPASLQWVLDVYTLQELTPDDFARLQEQQADMRNYRNVAETIERGLIQQYKPCLNSMWSRGKSTLPEKYRWNRIANEGVKITEEED